MSKGYTKSLEEAKNSITEFLLVSNIAFNNIKNRYRIKCSDKSMSYKIIKDIDSILMQCFNTTKVVELRRYNYYDGLLYLQFKRRI